MKGSLLLLLSCLSLNLFAGDLTTCPQYQSTDTHKFLCNKNGILVKETNKFSNGNHILFEYIDGKVASYSYFLSSGKLRVRQIYQHQQDSTIIKTSYRYDENQTPVINEKIQYMPVAGNDKRPDYLTRKWFFDKSDNHMEQIDSLVPRTDLVSRREIYNKNEKMTEYYLLSYDQEKPLKKHPESFVRFSPDGKQIGSITPSQFSIEELIAERGYSSFDDNKTLIGAIDTDFDLNHPLLREKIWINPLDPLNGIDDDNNGWLDDINGWNSYTENNQVLSPILLNETGAPISHGTHVASIAIENRDQVYLVGYAGNFTKSEYLRNIAIDINSKGIKFTNMSFAMGNEDNIIIASGLSASPDSIQAIQKMIVDTPNTLHVIAAGNAETDIDQEPTFPASSSADNTLVIGALDTDTLDESLFHTYDLAYFTNYGAYTVDILAPGFDVNGAALGGGMVRFKGTSMASPYALNHGVMEVYLTYTDLDILQIKEIIMKTAYIPDLNNPFPVRSGGILFPRRAKAATELLLEDPGLTIEEACLAIRLDSNYTLTGEEISDQYQEELKQFWKRRKI